MSDFSGSLKRIGIGANNSIFVPGNHDINRIYVKDHFSILKSLQERSTTESAFNNSIYGDQKDIISGKFSEYISWQSSASQFNLPNSEFCGKGFSLCDDIGVYCLNTASYSFGGLNDDLGNEIIDEGMLPVETRNLHAWLQSTRHKYRILAMHHPISWLTEWGKKELSSVSSKYFDMILCGHTHENAALHKFDGSNSTIECVAPPLFTRKSETLGYSIISIDENTMSTKITQQAWRLMPLTH